MLNVTQTPNNSRKSLRKSLNVSLVSIPNDDDEERANRRLQHQTPEKNINLNESQIAEQFAMYTQLYNENKISVKNVWSLQIIDFLPHLCQKTKDNVLQVASTSIDICAKVYGLRVDDLHSQALKLAADLARSHKNDEEQNNEQENDNEEGDNLNQSTKKKKTKKRKTITGVKTTIGQNNDSLYLKNLPKMEPADLININDDMETIDKLLTNTLRESAHSFGILEKSQKLICTLDDEDKQKTISFKDICFPDTNTKIIGQFLNYNVSREDPEHEGSLSKLEQTSSQPVVFDDNGLPMHELDGSLVECFGDNNNDEEHISEYGNVPHMASKLQENIIDYHSQISVTESEYCFNPDVYLSEGKPSHWKLKCIQGAKPKFLGKIPDKKRKRGKQNKEEMIDFLVEPKELDKLDKLDIAKPVKRKRATADVAKLTLPSLNPLIIKKFRRYDELMLKPGVFLEKKNTTSLIKSCENPNDSHNRPGTSCDDNNDDFANKDDNNEEFRNIEDNLVKSPEMVPNTKLSYISKAKQMDMKKLKEAMWTKLSKESENQNDTSVVEQKFSFLYQSLPEVVGPREKKDLSGAIAFVALLHLATEKNLDLKPLPGGKDCIITRSDANNSELSSIPENLTNHESNQKENSTIQKCLIHSLNLPNKVKEVQMKYSEACTGSFNNINKSNDMPTKGSFKIKAQSLKPPKKKAPLIALIPVDAMMKSTPDLFNEDKMKKGIYSVKTSTPKNDLKMHPNATSAPDPKIGIILQTKPLVDSFRYNKIKSYKRKCINSISKSTGIMAVLPKIRGNLLQKTNKLELNGNIKENKPCIKNVLVKPLKNKKNVQP